MDLTDPDRSYTDLTRAAAGLALDPWRYWGNPVEFKQAAAQLA